MLKGGRRLVAGDAGGDKVWMEFGGESPGTRRSEITAMSFVKPVRFRSMWLWALRPSSPSLRESPRLV